MHWKGKLLVNIWKQYASWPSCAISFCLCDCSRYKYILTNFEWYFFECYTFYNFSTKYIIFFFSLQCAVTTNTTNAVLCGYRALLHTDAARAAFHHACRSAASVSIAATTRHTTSTCFCRRRAARATVATSPSWRRMGKNVHLVLSFTHYCLKITVTINTGTSLCCSDRMAYFTYYSYVRYEITRDGDFPYF